MMGLPSGWGDVCQIQMIAVHYESAEHEVLQPPIGTHYGKSPLIDDWPAHLSPLERADHETQRYMIDVGYRHTAQDLVGGHLNYTPTPKEITASENTSGGITSRE